MKLSNIIVVLLLGLSTWVFTSCSEDSDTANEINNSPGQDLASMRSELINHTTERIILPGYRELNEKSSQLLDGVNSFIQQPDMSNLASLRQDLKEAWVSWQKVSVYIFGPSEKQALRNALNTYPVNGDKIEDNLINDDYVLTSLTNRDAVGFPAIDYLINGLANTDELLLEKYTDDAQSESRKEYLLSLATVIAQKVEATLTEWEANGGNYAGEFNSPEGLGTDVGSSLSLLVNAMEFHYQRFVRDAKLGIPAGVRSAGVPRPIAVEARYGQYSIELLTESLSAYRRLFIGTGNDDLDGTGLYDYLVALDAQDLADDILAQFDKLITDTQTLKDPFSAQIEDDIDTVNNYFLEMQKIVPLLKSDMASLMGITITNQDNDGD